MRYHQRKIKINTGMNRSNFQIWTCDGCVSHICI